MSLMDDRLMRSRTARHIDFAGLAGCIPTNPRAIPCDIDMALERNGHFLVGEWKRAGETFGGGQYRMLEALAKAPKFIVLLIEGDTDEEMMVRSFDRLCPSGKRIKCGSSRDDLILFIRRWYSWADNFKEGLGCLKD